MLIICQVFFIIWGVVVAAGFGSYGVRMWMLLTPRMRSRVKVHMQAVAACSTLGVALCCSSAVWLAVPVTPTHPAYFALMTFMR